MWLDIETSRNLLAPLTDLGIETKPRPNLLHCPVCSQVMGPRHSKTAAVEVDECPPHGVWFDHDELVRVSETVSRLRGAKPTAAQRAFAHWGPPVAAGAVGAALGAAALSTDDDNRGDVDIGGAADLAVNAGDVVDVATDVAAEGAVEAAGGVFEMAGDAVELAGGVLEGVLSVVGGIFEGLS